MSKSPAEKAEELIGPLTERPRKMKCIFPDNHKHGDRRPSATLYPNGYHCFACGANLSVFQYYCHTEGLTPQQAFARLGITTFSSPLPTRDSKPALNRFLRDSIDAPGIAPFRSGVAGG